MCADKVYQDIKARARAAILANMEREREGDQIDRALLKNTLEIFQEVCHCSSLCMGCEAKACCVLHLRCLPPARQLACSWSSLVLSWASSSGYGIVLHVLCTSPLLAGVANYLGEHIAEQTPRPQVGMNSLECYETDFEVALLEASADFYKRKAAAWIQVCSCVLQCLHDSSVHTVAPDWDACRATDGWSLLLENRMCRQAAPLS